MCTRLTLWHFERNYRLIIDIHDQYICTKSKIPACSEWENIIWNKNILTLYLYDLSYPCNIQCLLPSKHVDSPLRNPAFRVSLNNIDYLPTKRHIKQKWKNVDLMCFKVNSPAYSKPLRPHSTKNRPHSI